VLARDDGRYANSPLKSWFDRLASGNGLCCSFADGFRVYDVDWDTQDGHYRVRLNGEWIVVPHDAVVTEANKFGPAVVWPTGRVFAKAIKHRPRQPPCRLRRPSGERMSIDPPSIYIHVDDLGIVQRSRIGLSGFPRCQNPSSRTRRLRGAHGELAMLKRHYLTGVVVLLFGQIFSHNQCVRVDPPLGHDGEHGGHGRPASKSG
jgi:hypothetical protein